MTVHAINKNEAQMLRTEIELLMTERGQLLQVVGAAALFVSNLDTSKLPDDMGTIEAAEMLAEHLNVLTEESLKDALESVQAELQPEA
jgi:hypothetical protein